MWSAMHCGAPKKFAVISKEDTVFGTAEDVCLFQYRVEDRCKIAGRTLDDLQYLGGRCLPLQRLVTLGFALGELTLKIGYEPLGIG
jgi:hypothetical protein